MSDLNVSRKLCLSALEDEAARYGEAVKQMGVVTDEEGRVVSTAWQRVQQAVERLNVGEVVREMTVEVSDGVGVQKRLIADLEGEYEAVVKAVEGLGPGLAKGRLVSELVSIRAEIEGLKQGLCEFEEAEQRFGAGRSGGESVLDGFISGLQGVTGALGAAEQVVGLFGDGNEKLAKIQARLQSVLGVTIGMQQVSNTLHEASAFRMTVVRRITELYGIAQGKLAVALGVSTVAAKALMATLTLGLSVAITAIVGLISKWESAQSKAAEEQKKMVDVEKKATEGVASQVAAYKALQKQWQDLGGDMQKQKKFISDNKSEFDKMGVSIKTVGDAENLFITHQKDFIDSIQKRAQAMAAMEVATEKYKEALSKRIEADALKQNKSTTKTIKSGGVALKDIQWEDAKYSNEYKKLIKEAEGAEKTAGDYIKKQAEAYKASTDILDNAGVKTKGQGEAAEERKRKEEERLRLITEINRKVLDAESKFEKDRLNLLEEGRTKRLAEVDLEMKQKLEAINKEQRELEKKYKETGRGDLPGNVVAKYDLRREDIAAEAAKKRFDIEYRYNAETEELYEELGDVFLTEEERKTKAVENRYDEMRKAAREEYENEINAINSTKQGGEREDAIEGARERYNETIRFVDATQAQEELNVLLEEYEGYDKKRRELEEKFSRDMEALELKRTVSNSSEVTAAQDELRYRRDKALEEVDNEFASRSEEFELWMNKVAGLSLDKLYDVLHTAQEELARMESEGTGGNELAEARAKVNAIRSEVSKERSRSSESLGKRSIKEWEDFNKVLSGVSKQFEEIGNAVGGTAGEIISVAGGITSSTLKMIDGIFTLANSSIEGVRNAGTTVEAVIKSVEAASVVLAVISAAFQVAMKVASLFKGRSKQERDHERLEATTARIRETNQIINNLIEKRIDLIKKANAEERKGLEASTKDSIEIQKRRIETEFQKLRGNEILGKKGKNNDLDVWDLGLNSVEDLKEFLSSDRLLDLESQGYWLTDKDMWMGIVDSWDEINGKADELERASKEVKTNMTLEDAKSGLDEFLLDADATFEEVGESFEKHMQNAILGMVKRRYLNDAMEKWYDNFADATSDDVLSEGEVEFLQRQYEDAYNTAQEKINQAMNAAGLSLQGEANAPNAQTGAISETITEQTASELTGLWRGSYDTLKGIYTVNSSFYESYKSTMSICNIALLRIANNTGQTAENTAALSGMNDTLNRMDGRLKTIENNSDKKYI